MTERTVQQCWVAAVIRDDDGNVLVARWVDTQAWDLPSGVLRIGEDVCTGVRRVVSDTVTVGVTVGWLAGIHTHIRDGMTLVFPGAAQPVVH
jgi:predicted NUDIX family NTP pyrophosphohydrolase